MTFASQKRESLGYPLISPSKREERRVRACFNLMMRSFFRKITRKVKHLEDGCQDEE